MSLPVPAVVMNEDAQPYWSAAAEGRLVIPSCVACEHYIWYPRANCPSCGAAAHWREVSGRGVVYTYTICHRGGGEYADAVPYVLAYVELDEGPRVMTNVVDCDAADVSIGSAVRAVFHSRGDAVLLRFTLDASGR